MLTIKTLGQQEYLTFYMCKDDLTLLQAILKGKCCYLSYSQRNSLEYNRFKRNASSLLVTGAGGLFGT
jgi:hypothetical protein